MKKNTIHSVIALAALVSSTVMLSGCTDGKSEAASVVKRSQPVPVRIIELSSTESHQKVTTSGKITTDNETLHSFKIGGVVDRVLVQEGDAVKKGQVLATLDQTEINGTVSQAKLLHEKSLRDFERVERLFKDSVVTLEQLQNARTALDVSKEQLKTAEFNRQFSKIIASQNGFVLKKFVNPGQVVGIGDPIFLTNGASGANWILKVNATDKQWAMIENGDMAEITLDAFNQEVFSGKVIRKSETSDAGTGTFTIDIQVKNGKSTLASGMFAKAAINTDKKSNGWSIPYDALLDANGNEGFVFVTADYKTAIKQPVTIASIDRDYVFIATGLDNYKALIVSGSAYLTDKTPITIVK